MQKCGFCHMLSGVFRRAMCVGSRRGSSDSYYRELGDQDTLKIEDKSSDLSDDDAEEETSFCQRCRETPRVSPRSSPRASPRTSPRPSRQATPQTSPQLSRHASPTTSPPTSQRASSQMSPRPSRQMSLKTTPGPSRQASLKTSSHSSQQAFPPTNRRASLIISPGPSRQLAIRMASMSTCRRASSHKSPSPSRKTSPGPSRQADLKTSAGTSRRTSLKTSSHPIEHAVPSTSRRASSQKSPRNSRQPSLKTSPEPTRKVLQKPLSHSCQDAVPSTEQKSTRLSRDSRTTRRTSPRTSRRASPRPSHWSTSSSSLSSSSSSPESSRRTTPKISPWSSRRSSEQSSTSSWTRFSERRRSWLRYTKGSKLYYLHSDVQTDSMEEKDPAHYEMKVKKTVGRFLTMHKRRKKRLVTRCLFGNQGLLDDLMLGQVQCILNQSVDWKFNAFTLEIVSGGRCLPVLCVHLFQMYGLMQHFKLDPTKIWKLFSLIEEGYHSSNPYHNSVHAADVTQAMHVFLQQDIIRDHLTPLEIMASLLAAIAHDMDHPGVNQPFLVATSNHLAALYQNQSVLENHHWRSAMSCLVESGILDHLPPVPGLRERLVDQISSLILATDITRQTEYLTTFSRHLDQDTLDMTKSEHRHLVLQIALKCADISNPCRPWDISRKWSMKVCEEFFRQGDYERRLNLPVSALCDRHTNSIPKIQTGFFKFVVKPLINEWHRFLKNDLSSQMLCNLMYNQNRWQELDNEERNEETKIQAAEAPAAPPPGQVADDENRRTGDQRLLLPLRRGSLNPVQTRPLREQLRRFSVPLNLFQDTRFRDRERGAAGPRDRERGAAGPRDRERGAAGPRDRERGAAGPRDRERAGAGTQAEARARRPSVGSQATLPSPASLVSLNLRAHSSHSQEPDLQTLLPDSTIASITTPAQAIRLSSVLQGSVIRPLVRQHTFPPLESTSSGNDDDDVSSRLRPDFVNPIPSTSRTDHKLVVRDMKKTDSEDSDDSDGTPEPPRHKQKEKKENGRKSSTVGSQLRDNLTWMPLELESEPLLQRRRKSMPSEDMTPREKKIIEVPKVVPQFLRRTFSSKESWTKRRGSAPSPGGPSELRGLVSPGSLRHKPSLACQQWLTRAYGVQERAVQHPRRSSLPAEVMTGVKT